LQTSKISAQVRNQLLVSLGPTQAESPTLLSRLLGQAKEEALNQPPQTTTKSLLLDFQQEHPTMSKSSQHLPLEPQEQLPRSHSPLPTTSSTESRTSTAPEKQETLFADGEMVSPDTPSSSWSPSAREARESSKSLLLENHPTPSSQLEPAAKSSLSLITSPESKDPEPPSPFKCFRRPLHIEKRRALSLHQLIFFL